jgi:hypothetical protein
MKISIRQKLPAIPYLLCPPVTTSAVGFQAPMERCAYPGDILTYECTLKRGFATVWTLDIYEQDIVFLHSPDEFSDTKQISCCNGTIVWEDVSVDNKTHTSRVNITASCELNGTTIQCAEDNGQIALNSTILGKLNWM